MIRKIFKIVLCVMWPQVMWAQTSPVMDSARIDSLERVVGRLQERVSATEEENRLARVWKRKKFLNMAFVKQSLTHQELAGLKWKSDFGASFQMGRTYYLHRKPLGGMVKFGIDWVCIDMNYAKYSPAFSGEALENQNSSEGGPSGAANEKGFEDFGQDGYRSENGLEFDLGCHQFETSMQVGPSVTVNPVKYLMVNGYFRYAPSFSGVLLDDEFHGGFASFFTAGGLISWKAIGLGVEARWGKAKYSSFSFEEDEGDVNMDDSEDTGLDNLGSFFSTKKNRMKTSSFRVYLSFRF